MTSDMHEPPENNSADITVDHQHQQAAKVCYRHPNTETGLRCVRCERYICPKCAKRTPVGYICPECQRNQEDKYFNGREADYFLACLVALPLSLVANFAFYWIGTIPFFGWLIAFFGASFAAGLVSEAVRWVVQKRRSRYLPHTVIVCMIIAALPFFFFSLLPLFFGGGFNFFAIIPIVIFLAVGAGTVRLRLP